jgi:hypothetical protein
LVTSLQIGSINKYRASASTALFRRNVQVGDPPIFFDVPKNHYNSKQKLSATTVDEKSKNGEHSIEIVQYAQHRPSWSGEDGMYIANVFGNGARTLIGV